jgi:hypothetical protein
MGEVKTELEMMNGKMESHVNAGGAYIINMGYK